MILTIMIPAYNEENNIVKVISDLKELTFSDFDNEIDEIKIIVIDDGSVDNTSEAAREAGADKVVKFKKNRGLAPAFKRGLQECLSLGADIIVNIDADGQYETKQIPDLVEPIINDEADMVLGSRFMGDIEEMSFQKKLGNRLATHVTRIASGYATTDAQTGFRSLSKELAQRLNILSQHTYVQETIIKTHYLGYKITEIPISFYKREGDGKSRLIPNIFSYASNAGLVILKTYRDLYPLTFFGLIGVFLILLGFTLGINVLRMYLSIGNISNKLPSAVLSTLLILLGALSFFLGLIADMLKNQNTLLETLVFELKKNKC